jgi:hypothetical protein
MAQVVEHLPGMHEALSSNTTTIKKKKSQLISIMNMQAKPLNKISKLKQYEKDNTS